MSDHRQHAENSLALGDRRIHARIPVTPQAFVKFGENNYGFVFNISESGLVFAPTETLTLAVGATAKMRFQLPDSKEWIETGGEVAWIAESKKEAGVRFVDLTDDTRLKIRNWISQEPSRDTAEPVRDDKLLNSIFADPGLFLVESKSARPKPAVQPQPVIAEQAAQSGSAMHVPERRSQARRRVLSLEYLDLGESNGGIILNLSEGGMYVQAVASLSADLLSNLSFRIPDSGYQVEASGRVAWVGESRKDAGIQFIDLPEEARLKIRDWVAAENPAREESDQSGVNSAPVARKPERLVEMPRTNLPSAAVTTADIAVERISRKQSDVVGASLDADFALPAARKPANISPAAEKISTAPQDNPALEPDALASGVSVPAIAARTSAGSAEDLPDRVIVQRRRWAGMAAALILVLLLSFVAGWMAAGPNGRKHFMEIIAGQPANSPGQVESAANNSAQANAVTVGTHADAAPAESGSQPPSTAVTENRGVTATENPQSKKQVEPAAPLPNASNVADASKHSNDRPTPSAIPAARVPAQPPLATAAPHSAATAAPENKLLQPQPAQPPAVTVSSNAPGSTPKNTAPSVSNASAPVATASANSPPPANSNPSAVRVDAAPPSSTAKPSVPAEVVKGTVSVSASPVPSIRIPPELKSQISRQGAALQIGQLISRVEPVYPEDAEHQRIEGVVKLHVIIGRDGNVQDVDQMSGPPLLVAAAANAVRQWRYNPTSLGGVPVEAGESVTVTFRLQSTHAN